MSHDPALYTVAADSAASLTATNGNFQNGDFAFVAATASYYTFNETSGAAPDGVNVILTNLGGASRWLVLSIAGDPGVVDVAITTTNAVATVLFQRTLGPGESVTFRAMVLAVDTASAAIVGKFIREFTAKRLGAAPATLLQDLVPSPDYQNDPGLALDSGVNASNATLTATGFAGTLIWRGRIESVA